LDFRSLRSDVAHRSKDGVAVMLLDLVRIKVRPDPLGQVLGREGVVALAVKYFDERSLDSAGHILCPLWEQFIDYNFEHGWFVYSDPIISANWQAQGTKWTVPVGGGGRIIRIGKLPIKLEVGLFYNLAQPAPRGRWVLNTDLALIF
jgi:hypothetical protein